MQHKNKEYFTLKQPLRINEIRSISPYVLMMFAHLVRFAYEKDLPVVVTSIIRSPEENARLAASSKTHVEGRALDISVKGWSDQDLSELEAEINLLFKQYGAISYKTGRSRPIVIHNGTAPHIHLQSRPF